MTASMMAIPGLIGTVLHILVLIGALIMVLTRAQGRAKQLGVAGVVVLLVAAMLQPLLNVVLSAIVSAGTDSFFVIQVVNLLLSVVDLVGIVLLVVAVIVGSTGKTSAPGVSAGPSGVSGGWDPSSPGPRPR